jgi:hypothetical protein
LKRGELGHEMAAVGDGKERVERRIERAGRSCSRTTGLGAKNERGREQA